MCENRNEFENIASMCVQDMLNETDNHNRRVSGYSYKIAVSLGFERMSKVYMDEIVNKFQEDHVAGGSKLAKFMWDYMKAEYDQLELERQ